MTRFRMPSLALKVGLVAALGIFTVVPVATMAQDRHYYDDDDYYYEYDDRYDSCHERRSDNATGGAVTGAIVGGAAGAAPGAFVGAIIGSAIGGDSTRCRGRHYHDEYSYNDEERGHRYDRGWNRREHYRSDNYGYRDRYYDRRSSRRSDW